MSAREPEPPGAEVLSRLASDMVRAQKEFFGKGPTEAKAYLLDDLLFIVMRGGLTAAERTMLSSGQPELVRRFRQLFETEMTDEVVAMVSDATGRKVLGYQSQVMFDPDLVIATFVLERPGKAAARDARATESSADDGAGWATAGEGAGRGAERVRH